MLHNSVNFLIFQLCERGKEEKAVNKIVCYVNLGVIVTVISEICEAFSNDERIPEFKKSQKRNMKKMTSAARRHHIAYHK
jgi:hypothetical protein